MEHIPILAPAAVLVLWSLIMLAWVTATRFPAFSKAGLTVGEAEPGSRYVDVEHMLPAKVNWKSHNYTIDLRDDGDAFSGFECADCFEDVSY